MNFLILNCIRQLIKLKNTQFRLYRTFSTPYTPTFKNGGCRCFNFEIFVWILVFSNQYETLLTYLSISCPPTFFFLWLIFYILMMSLGNQENDCFRNQNCWDNPWDFWTVQIRTTFSFWIEAPEPRTGRPSFRKTFHW